MKEFKNQIDIVLCFNELKQRFFYCLEIYFIICLLKKNKKIILLLMILKTIIEQNKLILEYKNSLSKIINNMDKIMKEAKDKILNDII